MSGFGLIGVCLSKKASDEQPREAPFHKKGPLSLLFWGSGYVGTSRIFHFKQGETATQRGDATSPRSHSLSGAGQDSGLLNFQPYAAPRAPGCLPGDLPFMLAKPPPLPST